MSKSDLHIPEGLSALGRSAAQAILEKACNDSEDGKAHTGGCPAFFHPFDWADRGEDYGLGSELIVLHDGGCFAQYFNYDYMNYGAIDEMTDILQKLGLYGENCTGWYSAIYKIRTE